MVVAAVAIAATAMLPSAVTDRTELLATSGTLVAGGVVWFRVIPRSWFGSARPGIGSSIVQLLAAASLASTGGAQSPYFGLYSFPVLATAFQLQPRRTVVVGALGMLLYWLVSLNTLITMDPVNPAVRDTAVLRSVVYACVATVAWLLTQALARSRAEVIAERSRLRAVIDALKHPVLVTSGGTVEIANAAARTFFGPSVIGRPFQQLIPDASPGPSVIVDATGRALNAT